MQHTGRCCIGRATKDGGCCEGFDGLDSLFHHPILPYHDAKQSVESFDAQEEEAIYIKER